MIVNGAACGQDATYNAVRLSASMAKREEVTLRVFLMGDGVTVAMAGQKTPVGYYKLDRMLSVRDITEAMITEGAKRSTMDELTDGPWPRLLLQRTTGAEHQVSGRVPLPGSYPCRPS